MKIKPWHILAAAAVIGGAYYLSSKKSDGQTIIEKVVTTPGPVQVLTNTITKYITTPGQVITQYVTEAAKTINPISTTPPWVQFAENQIKAGVTDILTGYSVAPAAQAAAEAGVSTAISSSLGFGATNTLASFFTPQVVGTVAPVVPTSANSAGLSGQTTPSLLYNLAGVSTAAPFSTVKSPTSSSSTSNSNTTQAAIIRTLQATAINAPKGSSGITNVPYGTVGTGVNAGYVATGSGVWRKIQ